MWQSLRLWLPLAPGEQDAIDAGLPGASREESAAAWTTLNEVHSAAPFVMATPDLQISKCICLRRTKYDVERSTDRRCQPVLDDLLSPI